MPEGLMIDKIKIYFFMRMKAIFAAILMKKTKRLLCVVVYHHELDLIQPASY